MMTGYETAVTAIREGRAKARSLWVLLTDENERDGFWLKPRPWEGKGEYQMVEFADGDACFVKIGERHLPR